MNNPMLSGEVIERGSGTLTKGVGRLTLPKNRPPGGVNVTISDPRQIEVRLRQLDESTLNIEAFHNGQPLLENLTYTWEYIVPPRRELLKESPEVLPKEVSLLRFNFGPDGAYLDFGFVPPYLNQQELPERSIDVHTRLRMAPQMFELLMQIMNEAAPAFMQAREQAKNG